MTTALPALCCLFVCKSAMWFNRGIKNDDHDGHHSFIVRGSLRKKKTKTFLLCMAPVIKRRGPLRKCITMTTPNMERKLLKKGRRALLPRPRPFWPWPRTRLVQIKINRDKLLTPLRDYRHLNNISSPRSQRFIKTFRWVSVQLRGVSPEETSNRFKFVHTVPPSSKTGDDSAESTAGLFGPLMDMRWTLQLKAPGRSINNLKVITVKTKKTHIRNR